MAKNLHTWLACLHPLVCWLDHLYSPGDGQLYEGAQLSIPRLPPFAPLLHLPLEVLARASEHRFRQDGHGP